MRMIKFLTTDEFWEKMCHPGFYRVSKHQGVMCGATYLVDIPPEDVDGFMEAKIDECIPVHSLLVPRKSWLAKLLA